MTYAHHGGRVWFYLYVKDTNMHKYDGFMLSGAEVSALRDAVSDLYYCVFGSHAHVHTQRHTHTPSHTLIYTHIPSS